PTTTCRRNSPSASAATTANGARPAASSGGWSTSTGCGFWSEVWRKGWDSNPRYPCRYAGFQDRCLKPLGHPSTDRPAVNRAGGLALLGTPSQWCNAATLARAGRLSYPGFACRGEQPALSRCGT